MCSAGHLVCTLVSGVWTWISDSLISKSGFWIRTDDETGDWDMEDGTALAWKARHTREKQKTQQSFSPSFLQLGPGWDLCAHGGEGGPASRR